MLKAYPETVFGGDFDTETDYRDPYILEKLTTEGNSLICSSAHAEIVALSLAQKLLGVYDLGADDLPPYQLVVNWRPCSMCFGAVLWSGIRSLIIAGSGAELEDMTGFDEGPLHPSWRSELMRRSIEVRENILRQEAVAVFEEFSTAGGFVYNARLGQAHSDGPKTK
ncbi:MAG: nucleoside deaminase [Candidatus Electrothrix sp. AUS1_2]|nr:nucleoside deaminase [Candidatus Electrothrix sp. AUS1_2]